MGIQAPTQHCWGTAVIAKTKPHEIGCAEIWVEWPQDRMRLRLQGCARLYTPARAILTRWRPILLQCLRLRYADAYRDRGFARPRPCRKPVKHRVALQSA